MPSRQALPRDPRTDPQGISDGFDCVCSLCGRVFWSYLPESLCGDCECSEEREEEDA